MTRILEAIRRPSIVVQLGFLIVASQLIAHVLTILIMSWRFDGPDPVRFFSTSTLKAAVVSELVQGATPDERSLILRRAASVIADIKLIASPPQSIAGLGGNQVQRVAITQLMPNLLVPVTFVPDASLVQGLRMNGPVSLFRQDDTYTIAASSLLEKQRMPLEGIIVTLTILLVVVPLALVSLWGVSTLTFPLRRFALSADRFATHLDPTPFPTASSAEMHKLAHAFNTMRERISALLQNRSRMLAAVSHDLRTPLTRLRLRVEAQPDDEDRRKSLRDLSSMDVMIGQALAFLRDEAATSKRERVDLGSLVATVTSDYQDAGRAVTLNGPRNLNILGEPDLLIRALNNIIDNALKFGTRADVVLEAPATGGAVIRISDDGSGMSTSLQALAFEPFTRGDQARGEGETQGFGMGLAIAKQIVDRHEGTITLANRSTGGLEVEIHLPDIGRAKSTINSVGLSASQARLAKQLLPSKS